ncbi:ATP-binding protein [Stenotrophomonas sp. SY1]|uniref:ATP-binding protein n=1 Tax=Stenotrophomonas sp. SY1 TaxID=477235 RepID=UPI001E48C63B|nr:ATP-binding protein [Stenotrophomonas sp. SY1]MCD9085819.1 ATP-binding protein [Stenotrophomonas sp. SY1]
MTMATVPETPELPEYAGNPFIARLPPLQSQRSLYAKMLRVPHFDEKEVAYPAHVRKHCIVRLAKCFLPQARQVDLADRFSLLLLQGYVGRNPLTHDYLSHLQNGFERIERKSLEAVVSMPVQNTANSFALLGCPGVGKTLAMNCVLEQYPQVIWHEQPQVLVQIVWLRLEAPALGSLKQLCIDFFQAIDQLIGTDYVKRYATGVTVEQMLLQMAYVSQLHALGVLVIDEIQHLRGVKVGADALMKFLVKLVNTIGLPVIPIGTLGALEILRGTFSQARRSTGLGFLVWERMAPDAVWNRFIEQFWKYQWTTPRTELSDELNAALYDECQGVADLAVKLFMLAQLRLVGISEVRKGKPEILTPELIRRVAKEEFVLVAPMIEALRQNDAVKLGKFDDLRSLNDHIGVVLSRTIAGAPGPADGTMFPVAAEAGTRENKTVDSALLASLRSMGVAQDVAMALVDEAVAKNPSGDPLLLLQKIVSTLTASPPKRSSAKPTAPPPNELPEDDLRRLVAKGKQNNTSAYETLLIAGVVRPPITDFAA